MHAEMREMEMVGVSRSKSNDDHHPRFMQPLIHGFLLHFSIPVSFQKHLELEGHLLESAVLVTEDQPQQQWIVNVKDGRHFKDGWKEFCVDHNLKVGDFLVFTLDSRFAFRVSVFDPFTACDRRFSSKPQAPSEQAQFLSCCVPITAYSYKRATIYLPMAFTRSCGLVKRSCNIKLIDDKAIPWQVKLSYRRCGQAYISQGWKVFQIVNNISPTSAVTFQLIEAGRIPILKCSVEKQTTTRVSVCDPLSAYQHHLSASKSIVSNINRNGSNGTTGPESSRKGIKIETETSESHTQESTKIPSEQMQFLHCYVTISDSYLKGSFVCLPKHFMESSGLANRSCFVKLIDENGIPWQVRLRCRKYDGQASLNQGWQAFVRANSFKIRSIVCFQLIQAERIPILRCSQVTSYPHLRKVMVLQ